MPDISLCQDHKCPFNKFCYRYTAIPNPHWQSYGGYKYDKGCTHFWANTEQKEQHNSEKLPESDTYFEG